MKSLKETLGNEVKNAMRSGDRLRRDTLRMALAAIKQVEVDRRVTLDDKEVLSILQKEAKKRQESIDDFAKAGRPEAAQGEEAELVIIQEFLPAGVTEEEIVARATAIINEQELGGPRSIGPVMKQLMDEFQGRVDGRLVNQVVRRLLSA